MTTMTLDTPRPRPSALGPIRRTGFRDALAFEWIKIRSVRSTLWTLLATAALVIGISTIAGAQTRTGTDAAGALANLLDGMLFGQLAMVVFGVLAATGEYGTGTISTSFTAVPDRTRLLAAKALVVWAVATVVGMVVSFATFFAGSATLHQGVAHPSLSDGSVLRAVIGLGGYFGILAVFSLALGLILRASAGAITAAIAVTLVAPIAFVLLGNIGTHLAEWWPTEAGRQVVTIGAAPGTLGPLAGIGYFAAVSLALLVGAVTLVNRRDA